MKSALLPAALLIALPATPPLPQPRPEIPQASACHAALETLGARFTPQPAITDPVGCAVADPVLVSAFGAVGIEPPALLDCATALTVGPFVNGPVQAAALKAFGQPVSNVSNDSAYVCRVRNGTQKLSEHAFGRALDIGAFRLAGGRIIAVTGSPPGGAVDQGFLTEVRTAACGPFSTVLGPGSDADHALHFHFDTAARRSGPYCR